MARLGQVQAACQAVKDCRRPAHLLQHLAPAAYLSKETSSDIVSFLFANTQLH